jgi:6,7-dimethyl-8-ribityllumazine synthase
MKKYKVLIVAANYYPEITKELLKGAKKVKKAHTYHDEITVHGIFEIPVVISKNIDSYDGFVALGCAIKGKTPHFELISKAVIIAIMNLSIAHKKPIGNGILACLNKRQALQRLGKGAEASNAVEQVFINTSKLKSKKI